VADEIPGQNGFSAQLATARHGNIPSCRGGAA